MITFTTLFYLKMKYLTTLTTLFYLKMKYLTTVTTLFYVKMKSLTTLTTLFYFTIIKMKSLATAITLFHFTTIKMKSIRSLRYFTSLLLTREIALPSPTLLLPYKYFFHQNLQCFYKFCISRSNFTIRNFSRVLPTILLKSTISIFLYKWSSYIKQVLIFWWQKLQKCFQGREK